MTGRYDGAQELHSSAVVFNALDCTPLAYADDVYHGKLRDSGVTAINHAVSYSQDRDGALAALAGWSAKLRTDPGPLVQAAGLADVAAAKRDGKIAWFVGFEDSKPIGEDVGNLELFHRLGLRFLGLTYQNRNFAGDGSGETANAGLSRFGRRLVREANELGVALDLSHTGERSTLETIEASAKPVLVTHAGLRHFVDSPRNKSDAEAKLLAERGGAFGLAAKSGFLSPTGLTDGSDLDTFVDNIDYLVELIGIDHVIVGTDNGDERKYTREGMARVRRLYPEIPIIGDDLNLEIVHPRGLGDPKDLPNITGALLRRGYTPEDVRKILGENLLRVLAEIWS
ncbi:membrane dipeptidase [Actinomadura vinacea]|uniref:Membrane dipeptidase n=1 Tax=Actinomadura vinacea TaxID=115336 RepID=A0ABP5XFL2_9ACTN